MYKSKDLIAIAGDAKTVKGAKLAVTTGIMYLAPYDVSGFQVCPNSTAECRAACLYTAGHGRYSTVQQGRINKTKWFFQERDTFMLQLYKNIESLVAKAKKLNTIPAVRLNGTSDIAWEKIAFEKDGVKYRSIIHAFPNVQFYDYSKILGRKSAIALHNYHLTFSLSENNDADAIQALQQGYNVAVVLKLNPTDEKPETWGGYPVINGDETDVRFQDAKGGHIVALTAKGTARKMPVGGFIRLPTGGFNVPLSIQLVA